MGHFLAWGAGAVVLLLAGCGGTVITIPNAADSGPGSVTADAAATPGKDGGLPAPGTDASTGFDGGSGSCGSAKDCAKTEFCEHKGTCGSKGSPGRCVSRPMGCTDLYAPACACDGKTYANVCEANAAGQDLSSKGGCPAPQGYFSCGNQYCSVGSYCQTSGNDAPTPENPTDSYACKPLPQSCMGKKDCACFPKETPCFNVNQCKAIPVGNDVGFHIICPGG